MARKVKKNNKQLQEDVKALGGDADDYEMLMDVNEDAPVASSSSAPQNDRALSNDVKQLMKKLQTDAKKSNDEKAPEVKKKAKVDPVEKASEAKRKTKKSKADVVEKIPEAMSKAKKGAADVFEKASETKHLRGKKSEADAVERAWEKKKSKKSKADATEEASDAKHPKAKKTKANLDTTHETELKNVASVLTSDAGTGQIDSKKEGASKDVKPIPSSSKSFVVQPVSNWYDAVPALSSEPLSQDTATITTFSARAEKLLAQDVSRFDAVQKQSNASDAGFVQRVLSSGTLSDKLSALTLLVQGSPLHNQAALENLRGMARKKSREGSLKAVRAIVDWWVGGGAPDRKLKYFRDQPLSSPDFTDAHLVVWYFEDWLKKYFFSILQILEALSMDPLPYVRLQACTFIFQLLRDKPEQEQNLLRLLVNKLGDGERSVASRVSYHIMQLLQAHPQMKAIVISEVEASAILGSGKKSSGQYYVVITFNQMVLTAKESVVANRLMDLYFKLFREMLGEKDQDKQDGSDVEEKRHVKKTPKKEKKRQTKGAKDDDDGPFGSLEDDDSKMISAILTGINRALPFASLQETSFTNHIDTLFRITHQSTFNISIQALMLIDHVVSSLAALPSSADLSNRFYRTLYAALLDPRLPQSGSKHALFLTLLARAMRRDEESSRRAAFVRRLVTSLAMHGPGFACAALVMLGRLSTQRPEVHELIAQTGKDANVKDKYDPSKREPLYAHAQSSCLWELIPLLHHYHPSVALHARQLRDGERLTGAPDVGLYSLASFLDRFVLKNAKKPKTDALRGASAMQPGSHAHEAEVDEEQLGKMNEDDVDPELLFYHRFVKIKDERERKMGRRKKKKDDANEMGVANSSDDEAVNEDNEDGSELDEDEIWAAMKGSAAVPEDDVDLDDDSDLELPSSDDGVSEDGDSSDASSNTDEDGDSEASDNDMEFLEDDDDVVDDDELIDFPSDGDGEEHEEEEWGGIDDEQGSGKKRKRSQTSEATKRKKRLRELPTFATYDDYQRMIEDEPDNNI